ncbi:TMM81 protein, partial [Formicarius rufipectus]|nr:TMM81 protein [Formicarius rufipectus]
TEALDAITFPPELLHTVVKVALNSTPCSVTCGLGLKVELMCEVTPAGERHNCSLVPSLCLGTWMCGIRHLSLRAGQPLRLGCLIKDLAGFGNHTYSYTWRWAPGLITTDDVLFNPLRSHRPIFKLPVATEAAAGTYRCDVRVREDSRLVKRIYFGLRVILSDLVNLNFQESLSWQQKLGQGSARNGSWKWLEHFWEKEEFYGTALGVGSVALGVIVVGLVLCCCLRLCRK